jgi:hypothetical protein
MRSWPWFYEKSGGELYQLLVEIIGVATGYKIKKKAPGVIQRPSFNSQI